MHIKTIVLQGFKSYRDQGPVSEGEESKEFSRGANLIVGKNGSGKSNFFDAVQFVLGQGSRFQKIAAEHRRDLLHEGTGRSVLSAFVEVVFDNTDQRLVVGDKGDKHGDDEDFDNKVVIRRTVGLKKDEYRVNNKTYSSNEVQQLLETAGLSSQNPYNIVQQGRVTEFAMMSDERRCQVIKDVAGTQLYENRRGESSNLLETTVEEMGQIEKHLTELDDRLNDASQEREEFKQYQVLERKRRALQYCYYKRDADDAKTKLDSITEEARGGAADSEDKNKALDGVDKKLQDARARAELENQRLAEARSIRSRLIKESGEVGKKYARSVGKLKDAKQTKEESSQEHKKVKDELAECRSRIEVKAKDQNKLEKDVQKAHTELQSTTANYRKADQRKQELMAKRKRKEQFGTKAERDKYLKDEIKKLEASISGFNKDLSKQKSDLEKAGTDKVAVQKSRTERDDGLAERQKKFAPLREEAKKATTKLDQLADKRRGLFSKQAELQREHDETKEKETAWEDKLRRLTPGDVRRGLDHVKEIVTRNEIQGVYGPALRLFEVPAELRTACDVVAGNQLFHIVVDSSETVHKIMTIFNKEKKDGRPSFFPINRLNAVKKDLPTRGEECFPLMDKIKSHPHYQKVMADLFGKVLVCRDLPLATAYSRSQNCDCVTAQGDRVDRRGGISGGWRGADCSKVEAQAEVTLMQTKVSEIDNRLVSVKEQGTNVEKDISTAREKVSTAERAVEGGQRWAEREGVDQRTAEARLADCEIAHVTATKRIGQIQEMLRDAEAQRAMYERELGTEMVQELSSEEVKELNKLQGATSDLEKTQAGAAAAHSMRQSELNKVLEILRSNLRRREADLKSQLTSLAVDGSTDHQSRAERDEGELKKRSAAIDNEIKDIDKEIEQHQNAHKKAQDEADDLLGKANSGKKKQEESRQKRVTMEEDRKKFTDRREEAMDRIRKIGVLPDSSKFAGKTPKQLLEEIAKVNGELKGYTKVNKKAAEQYVSLQEQTTKLHEQFDKRTTERTELEKLIKHLDEQKDNAVLRTFRQIKHHFQGKFRELVGHEGARGDLIIKKEKKTKDKKSTKTMEEFSAIQVKVNFGVGGEVGGDDKGDQDMSRLSGGQKSVVALALIFAIQAADPAPFYVFDEVDAALDAEYRTNVAKMIQSQSKDAQFLIASFKPEMVHICDKHFAIAFQNKVSRVAKCTPDHALRLLKAVETEEQRSSRRSETMSRYSTVNDSASETTAASSVTGGRKRGRMEAAAP